MPGINIVSPMFSLADRVLEKEHCILPYAKATNFYVAKNLRQHAFLGFNQESHRSVSLQFFKYKIMGNYTCYFSSLTLEKKNQAV